MYNKLFNVIVSLIFLVAVTVAVFWGLKSAAIATVEHNDTKDKPLIVIDPGHGGFDPGKIGINGEVEKNINLEISKKIKIYLEKEGYAVVLTRTEDMGLYSESDANKKASDMKQRCKIIEENKAYMVISIHQNSFTDENVCGAQVFYYKHSECGKELAQTIQNSIQEKVPEAGKRIIKSNDSYYMLIHTPCPTVIVECGFLSNYEEALRMSDDKYQSELAKAIAEGAVDFIKANE